MKLPFYLQFGYKLTMPTQQSTIFKWLSSNIITNVMVVAVINDIVITLFFVCYERDWDTVFEEILTLYSFNE